VVPHDPEYVAANDRLRATLARDEIQLDTADVIRTCDGSHSAKDCARCDVATAIDQIDPALVDAMAIELARFPASIRKIARLEHLAFCRAITYERGIDHGPAGLADPNTHRIFISVEYFRGLTNTDLTIEETVDHEVFHLLDYETQGVRWTADREWHALNPSGFAYHPRQPDQTGRPRGFVNGYALTDELEDRASTFEYLMARPTELCKIVETDPILARKVQLVWKRVAHLDGAQRLGMTASCTKGPSKPSPRPSKGKHGQRPTLIRDWHEVTTTDGT
jgi:hypothetical protein